MELQPAQLAHLADLVFAAVYQNTPNTQRIRGLNYNAIAREKLAGPLVSMAPGDVADMWLYIAAHQGATLPKPVKAAARDACVTVQDVHDAIEKANS